jgi:ABC-type bacteriocin/lantibiotic exporter with double-glycine peptidase domain
MGLIIWYGSNLVFDGKISVGEISAFLLFMIQLIINFAILALVLGNVSKVAGASTRIISLM